MSPSRWVIELFSSCSCWGSFGAPFITWPNCTGAEALRRCWFVLNLMAVLNLLHFLFGPIPAIMPLVLNRWPCLYWKHWCHLSWTLPVLKCLELHLFPLIQGTKYLSGGVVLHPRSPIPYPHAHENIPKSGLQPPEHLITLMSEAWTSASCMSSGGPCAACVENSSLKRGLPLFFGGDLVPSGLWAPHPFSGENFPSSGFSVSYHSLPVAPFLAKEKEKYTLSTTRQCLESWYRRHAVLWKYVLKVAKHPLNHHWWSDFVSVLIYLGWSTSHCQTYSFPLTFWVLHLLPHGTCFPSLLTYRLGPSKCWYLVPIAVVISS